jgi:hypothetical protein
VTTTVAAGAVDPDVEPDSAVAEPLVRERGGLFLAGDLGLGGHASSRETLIVATRGLGFRLVAGGMLGPGFALFGGVQYFDSLGEDFRLAMASVLVGGRFYLTSSGFYLETSVGTLIEAFNDDFLGAGGVSNTGWMAQLGAGKEWRFPSGLAIGLQARAGGGTVPAAFADENDPTVANLTFGLTVGYAGDR